MLVPVRMGSPPSPPKGEELWGAVGQHRGSISSCGSKPERLGEASRQPRQAAAGLPVPAATNLAGRRTVWPPAWNFWRSESPAHQPGEVAAHTPTARPCHELGAVGKQRVPGLSLQLPGQKHTHAGITWPRGNIIRAVSPAAGIQPRRTVAGTRPPCLAPRLPAWRRGQALGAERLSGASHLTLCTPGV